jgi:hypothetical protein
MSAVMSRWYWTHDGRQGGPVTWDELQGLAKRGSLRGSDLVLREELTTEHTKSTEKDEYRLIHRFRRLRGTQSA